MNLFSTLTVLVHNCLRLVAILVLVKIDLLARQSFPNAYWFNMNVKFYIIKLHVFIANVFIKFCPLPVSYQSIPVPYFYTKELNVVEICLVSLLYSKQSTNIQCCVFSNLTYTTLV